MPRPAPLAACVLLLVAALEACTNAPAAKDDKPSAEDAPNSIAARCRAQDWPQAMPDVVGQPFEPFGRDLMCFDNMEAVAPDGHDVMTDPASGLGVWTVTSSTPKPGAKVRITTPITLELRAAG
ncbi:hypothetical protein AB0M19_06065 [Streptomyces sp. NPDC051920]|uniref:PASTA domain-containing protein n=1 Tax=Streptomyces sp. NPDC051920 TaxID=3155523 RepID=UPI00341630F6